MESKFYKNQTNYIKNVFVSKNNIPVGDHQLRPQGIMPWPADTFH